MQSLGAVDVAAAWAAADKANESARELLSRSGRARLAFRSPALALSRGRRPEHGGRPCRPQAYDDAGGDHGRVRPRPLLRDPRRRQGRGADPFDTDEAGHTGGFDPDTDRENARDPDADRDGTHDPDTDREATQDPAPRARVSGASALSDGSRRATRARR